MGVFRLAAEGVDADDLELDLIDHALDEMLGGEGEDGQPQLIARCSFTDLGEMQRALEERDIQPVSARTEYVCLTPMSLEEDKEREVLELVDALEQDDDVQRVFHTLV